MIPGRQSGDSLVTVEAGKEERVEDDEQSSEGQRCFIEGAVDDVGAKAAAAPRGRYYPRIGGVFPASGRAKS